MHFIENNVSRQDKRQEDKTDKRGRAVRTYRNDKTDTESRADRTGRSDKTDKRGRAERARIERL
jgi:hypothetical protein